MELELSINQYLAAKGIRKDEYTKYRLEFDSVVFDLANTVDVFSPAKEADSICIFYKAVFSVTNYQDGNLLLLAGDNELKDMPLVPEKANNERTSFECSMLFQTKVKFRLSTIGIDSMTGFVKFHFVRIILL